MRVSDYSALTNASPQLLNLNQLIPGLEHPRSIGVDAGLAGLATSIQRVGILQPLIVSTKKDAANQTYYEIIAGHRRFRAAQLAGLTEIPCIITEAEPQKGFLYSIIENVQHNSLHPLDEAWAYDRLIEMQVARNRADIARLVGVCRARITQRMHLLELDDETKAILIRYATTLSECHARVLLTVKNLDARHHLAELAGRTPLSGRELRKIIEEQKDFNTLPKCNLTETVYSHPKVYQASYSGFRIYINYHQINRKQVLNALCKAAENLGAQVTIKSS